MIFYKTLKRIAEENKRPDDELHFCARSNDCSKLDSDHIDEMLVKSYVCSRFGDDIYYHVELATTKARE